MKGYFLAVLLCAAGAVSAQEQRLDVAKYSTRQVYGIVQQSGWLKLGDTDNETFWFAHTKSNPGNVGVAVKIASKSLNGLYSTIETDTASVDCSEMSSGNYPTVMHVFVSETDDAGTGFPVPGNVDEPAVSNLPIQRGTPFAEAVKRSCDAIGKTNVNITLALAADGSRTPKLLGVTNLPDGSKLSIDFGGAGSDIPYSKTVVAEVNHGHFETQPFSESGQPLEPGDYIADVEMIVPDQPPSVSEFIKRNAANFTGMAFPPRTIGYSTYQVVVENMAPIKIR